MKNLPIILICLATINFFSDIIAMKRKSSTQEYERGLSKNNIAAKKNRANHTNDSDNNCKKLKRKSSADLKETNLSEKKSRTDMWAYEQSWADSARDLSASILPAHNLITIMQVWIKTVQNNPTAAYEGIRAISNKILDYGVPYIGLKDVEGNAEISVQLTRFIAQLLIKLGYESPVSRKILYIYLHPQVTSAVLHEVILHFGNYNLYLNNLISIISKQIEDVKKGNLKTALGLIHILDDSSLREFVRESISNLSYRILDLNRDLIVNAEYTFLVTEILLKNYVKQDNRSDECLTELIKIFDDIIISSVFCINAILNKYSAEFIDIYQNLETDKVLSYSDLLNTVNKTSEEAVVYVESLERIVDAFLGDGEIDQESMSAELKYICNFTKRLKELIEERNQKFSLRAILILIIFSQKMIQRLKAYLPSNEQVESNNQVLASLECFLIELAGNLAKPLIAKIEPIKKDQQGQDQYESLKNLDSAFEILSIKDEPRSIKTIQ